MTTEQTHISQIKASFKEMASKDDLLRLLNIVKPLVYGEKTVPFQLKQLTWNANPIINKRRYREFKIKKKSGSFRSIHAPVNGLKAIQKTLSYILQCVYEPHNAAMGFVKNKSIVDNAKMHEGSYYVFNIDLKDFFQSIDQARFWKCLQLKPFNLTKSSSNRSSNTNKLDLANIITSLCCTEMEVERKNDSGEFINVKRNALPQGAPTSPVISNIICQRLDLILTGVAKRFGLKYSRYADDITFSSMHNVYQPGSDFINELHRIIAEQGFYIKDSKTRLQKEGYRKEVTGLVVNEKSNVQLRYIKQLRMWLYYWEKYGYEKAYGFFLQKYITEKGHVIKGKPDMLNVIAGKLDFLKMVKGPSNDLYIKLKLRFDTLIANNKIKTGNVFESSTTERVQDILMPSGLEIIGKNTAKENLETLTVPKKTLHERKHERLKFPIVHNPKELVTLLKNFSINDSALKYTTHSWDAGRDANMFKDLAGFLTLAGAQYKIFSFRLKTLSENLNGKIYNFLFNRNIHLKGWGIHRIKFGWSSPELLSQCNANSNLNPEDVILPTQYQTQIVGKTIQKFKHVIDLFKNEIEIRDEISTLLNLILQKHDRYLISFANPIITNLDNKTFYTDVQWLNKALDLIFDNIQKRPQHKEVRYSINDKREDVYVLEILQIDSFNIGKSINDEKLRLVRGDFGEISKYLKNLCDWSIESEFTEGFYRINYLSSDPKLSAFQKIERTEGFKHILTFYK